MKSRIQQFSDEYFTLQLAIFGNTGREAILTEEHLEHENAETILSEKELNRVVEQLCQSKAEEFHMIGYEHVSGQEIWGCISEKYHKTGMPALHQIVNDILSLKVTQFMNWMTMNVYRGKSL